MWYLILFGAGVVLGFGLCAWATRNETRLKTEAEAKYNALKAQIVTTEQKLWSGALTEVKADFAKIREKF